MCKRKNEKNSLINNCTNHFTLVLDEFYNKLKKMSRQHSSKFENVTETKQSPFQKCILLKIFSTRINLFQFKRNTLSLVHQKLHHTEKIGNQWNKAEAIKFHKLEQKWVLFHAHELSINTPSDANFVMQSLYTKNLEKID